MSGKKDKQARRLARKRKGQKPKAQQRTQPSGQDILSKLIQASEHLKSTKFIPSTGETDKMSDVIVHFAEPLQDEDGIVPPSIIRFAILVWNAYILKNGEQEEVIKEVKKSLPEPNEEIREIMMSIIYELLERKEKYFSDNKRVIIHYQITETDDIINLDVLSTLHEGVNPEV